MSEIIKINLGGGQFCPRDWVNLDPVHGEGDWKRQGQDVPWPVKDQSVSRILASHVMEHIPAGQARIDVFNEAHRVLQPGGRFVIRVPVLINDDGNLAYWTAIADPTHVSFWCRQSFGYFDGAQKAAANYGIKKWLTLDYSYPTTVWEAVWTGTPDY